MTNFLLGVIAISVLAMAIGQVVAVMMAVRAVRRMGDTLVRLEGDIRPIVTNVQQMSSDAARVAAIATAQVQRAEVMMDDVTRRVDETLRTVQETVLTVQDTVMGPARSGMAVFQGIRAALSVFFDRSPRKPRSHVQGPSPAAEEDDASFIG